VYDIHILTKSLSMKFTWLLISCSSSCARYKICWRCDINCACSRFVAIRERNVTPKNEDLVTIRLLVMAHFVPWAYEACTLTFDSVTLIRNIWFAMCKLCTKSNFLRHSTS